MGKIVLKNISTYSYHGCFVEENKIGSEYKLSLWVNGDFSKAEQTDSLKDTVDYVSLADLASKEMAISSKLIEHVANRILDKILFRWPEIDSAGITISKLSPPMNQYVESVDYTLERTQ